MSQKMSMHPDEAVTKLKAGNDRFVSGQSKFGSGLGPDRLKQLVSGQAPYATVLSCSDSRVPVEFIFDAGFGDVFICRNAGNIIDELILGSIEYAAAHTGCPVLLVLGHESCGACGATVAHYKDARHHETGNVDDIVRRIMPAVIATKPNFDEKQFVNEVARTNIINNMNHVSQRSPLLKGMVEKGDYKIIGGFYNLTSGKVNFLV